MARIQLASKLEQLGFSPKEAHVYLILLELKKALPSTLARNLNLNRSSVYGILKRLVQKSVVVEEKQKGYSYFRAIEPQRFLEQQKARFLELNRSIKHLEKKLPSILPIQDSNKAPQMQNEVSHSLKELLEKSRASLKIIRNKELKENEKIHVLEKLQEEILTGFLDVQAALSIPE